MIEFMCLAIAATNKAPRAYAALIRLLTRMKHSVTLQVLGRHKIASAGFTNVFLYAHVNYIHMLPEIRFHTKLAITGATFERFTLRMDINVSLKGSFILENPEKIKIIN